MSSFTIKQLTEVEDAAPRFGLDQQEVRFAYADLEAADTGVAHYRYGPGVRQPFGHRHDAAEEVYVVLSGSGRLKLDDEIVDLTPLDAIRVAPQVMRSFEAGPDGLEILACGPRHEGDGELVPGWWDD